MQCYIDKDPPYVRLQLSKLFVLQLLSSAILSGIRIIHVMYFRQIYHKTKQLLSARLHLGRS